MRLKKTTIIDVKDFLTRTGFILEMEVAEILRKKRYKVEVNEYFFDYDSGKKREIDIIATKQINKITICLVIECKQSLVDDWIFICSDKKPKRFYQYLKYSPQAEKIDETKIFNNLNTFDKNIPLAQNFIIKDRTSKKSNSDQINTCLEKLPKALVDVAFSKSINDRKIFLPVAVFSGQIFTAYYNNKLQAKSVEFVQYESILESSNYSFHFEMPTLSLFEDKKDTPKNSKIAKKCLEFGPKYLLNFTTKKGLIEFVRRIDSEVKKISLKKWFIEKEGKKDL
jgi:hypothetical protein